MSIIDQDGTDSVFDDSSGSPTPSESGGALFSGDEGGLTFAQRRCLVALLKHRYISRYTHPEQWVVLMAHRSTLCARLNDMFLTLHVDEEREVAYKRQAAPDDSGPKFPTLLFDTPYSREETVLLVVLRERLQSERSVGAELVSVDREDLVEGVSEFWSNDVTDVVAATKRTENAIASLVRMKILDSVGDDRFVITPVLDSLLPLDRLRELLEWLCAVNSGESVPSDSSVVEDDGTNVEELES